MNTTIGDLVHANPGQIRRHNAGGKTFRIEKKSMGYKTGQGWVTAQGPNGERGASWVDLTGVTIVIKPRQGHIPTRSDPEGWYVLTTYPDFATH